MVTVHEYLNTNYSDGDREYVDGIVVERNLGEKDHSKVQKRLTGWFLAREVSEGLISFPEQRVQVKPSRFRIPDICVYFGSEPDDQVFHTPPFLEFKILSKDDRASEMLEKVDDYLTFGVRFVWVIDPRRKTAVVHTQDAAREVKDGFLRTHDPEIALPLSYLFE